MMGNFHFFPPEVKSVFREMRDCVDDWERLQAVWDRPPKPRFCEPGVLGCSRHCERPSFQRAAMFLIFSPAYPPGPQGSHLWFLFCLHTLLLLGHLALSTLSHLSRTSPLQSWLFGTNPDLSPHPHSLSVTLNLGRAHHRREWRLLETPVNSLTHSVNSGPRSWEEKLLLVGRNSYRNIQRELSVELGQGKFCWGALGQWHSMSWERCQ